MALAARTKGSDDLKAIVAAVSTVVEEATFVASSEGITFRGMDPSHVALIDISWPNSAFESFSCDGDMQFGLRVDEISKLIRRADKKDAVELGVADDSRLSVSLGRNRRYKIRLIESSATDTPLPKITYDATVGLPISRLEKVLGDVEVVSDYVTIKAGPERATFSGRGDSGEVSIEMDKAGGEISSLEAKAESEGSYSLEYLTPVVKAVGPAVEEASCAFSTAKPLRAEFGVSGMGRIHFYLAPRVES